MQFLQSSVSNQLTLDQVLKRLVDSNAVDALALFGSKSNLVSDYDVLILVNTLPVPIFQMLTYINGLMADVIFVETATVDQIFEVDQPVQASSFEGLFIQKMLKAQIVSDKSGRLKHAQAYALEHHRSNRLLRPSSESDLYAVWFWSNHGLAHMNRMMQSDDPVYVTAVDMMLLVALGSICRDYCRVRNIPWQGEKAAIRHLQAHDPTYLELLRACIAEGARNRKLELYEQLVRETLKPIGDLWKPGITAVYLREAVQAESRLQTALEFWEQLLGS